MVIRQFFGQFSLRYIAMNDVQNFLHIVFLHDLSS